MKAVNIKEKLANVREICRGYSEYTYRFVDYVAEHLTDPVGPIGLTAAALARVREIESGCDKNGNALFPYFITNKDKILDVAWQFLQVIDVVTDDQFAAKFRELCERVLEWDALKRLTVTDDYDYPECVKVALDWWTGVIQAGRAYTGPHYDSEREETTYKRLTLEELKNFRRILAEGLIEKMRILDRCTTIEVAPYYSHSSLDSGVKEVRFHVYDYSLGNAMKAVGLSYDDGSKNAVPPHHSFYDQDCMWMHIHEDYILFDQGCDPTFLWWKDK